MSKLFKLKQWLTIGETAKHLSNVLSETVSETDVLQLGMDGHLTLSVNFVNNSYAKIGELVHFSKATYSGCSDIPLDFFLEDSIENLPTKKNTTPIISIGLEQVIEFDNTHFFTIIGVWDLPRHCKQEVDVLKENLIDSKGTLINAKKWPWLLVKANNEFMWLHERFNKTKYQSWSTARLTTIQQKISENNLNDNEAESLLNQYKIDREVFLKKERSHSLSKDYYPAYSFPDDSFLVVRTSVITDFLNTLAIEPEQEKSSTSSLTVTRENDFNTCLSEVINDFITRNGYTPNPDTVLDNLNHKPPLGYIVDFKKDSLSVNGAKPRQLDNVKRTIKSLLDKA